MTTLDILRGRAKSCLAVACALANKYPEPANLLDVADETGISHSWCEQLLAKLGSARLTQGVRGPGGGYKLLRAPSDVSVAEIFAAISGSDEKTLLSVPASRLADQTQNLFSNISLDSLVR